MKNYTYDTATEPVTIEVDEKWAVLLAEADTEEANANRKHTRSDRKYAPGTPVSFDSLDFDGELFADCGNEIANLELTIDLKRALATLTELQRRYFILNRLEGYSYAEIARREGKHKSTVQRLTESAAEKLKSFFE